MKANKIKLDNFEFIVRPFSRRYLSQKYVKAFTNFINQLVKEDAKILANKPYTIKKEREYLKEILNRVKQRKLVYIVAEHKGKIAGSVEIACGNLRKAKIAVYGIAIAKPYRGIGLGKYLSQLAFKMAKKLKPKPKIIRLEVFENNKPAIKLYEKLGFKKVAKIPKALEYKGKLIGEIVMMKELNN